MLELDCIKVKVGENGLWLGLCLRPDSGVYNRGGGLCTSVIFLLTNLLFMTTKWLLTTKISLLVFVDLGAFCFICLIDYSGTISTSVFLDFFSI